MPDRPTGFCLSLVQSTQQIAAVDLRANDARKQLSFTLGSNMKIVKYVLGVLALLWVIAGLLTGLFSHTLYEARGTWILSVLGIVLAGSGFEVATEKHLVYRVCRKQKIIRFHSKSGSILGAVMMVSGTALFGISGFSYLRLLTVASDWSGLIPSGALVWAAVLLAVLLIKLMSRKLPNNGMKTDQ